MNYTDLKTEIADYLNKDNLTDAIPGFITKAENKLNRRLRLREQNQLSTATLGTGARFIALPDDFIELIDLQIKKATEADTKYTPLSFEAPELFYQRYEDSTGTPYYYTLRDQIEVNREVAENHTVRIHYIKQWDIETDTTNWLLTNYEDAYVYGALMEAAPYLRDDSRVMLWRAALDMVVDELAEMDARSEDDSVLGTDVYRLTDAYSDFNIVKGE